MNMSKPQITSVINEMHSTIGQQVTLRLSFSGNPQPTVAWTFKGGPISEDPSVELSADGSLVIVCVEQRHAGRYVQWHKMLQSCGNIIASNNFPISLSTVYLVLF